MKITAAEARDLREAKFPEELNKAYYEIRRAAPSSDSVEMRGEFWENGSVNKTSEYLEIKKRLESEGFKLEQFWRESQFVDYGVKISW